MMAFATLQDFSGKGECIIFSDAYRLHQNNLHPEAMIMVVGKAEHAGDALRIIVNEVYPMEQVRQKFTKSITLSFTSQ